ncbi:MAG: glycosyltransferase family 2 protein [Patescibacteria group bacterium]|nr:glycosyltransferase family 2 protein [Patescibacteria group bacterium]MDD5121340.1 glycosyltransferase family 2 protein [Patescibacteria group bacterium]MDD5395741.1 glycosyltransferase family 2 protein [Patescibacteria group bacterium]
MKLSIIIPVYNERKTILDLLERIKAVKFDIDSEIIIIDDASTDGTREILKNVAQEEQNNYKIFFQEVNQGKGLALRRGFKEATGDIIAIQDADLEYNPQELPDLVRPISEGRAEVVYGSRFLTKHRPIYKIFYLGNRFLSFLFYLFYGHKINDPWTCYKVFKRNLIQSLELESNGFDLEIELTADFLKKKHKILEIPISYHPRLYKDGKKIKYTDGLRAIWAIAKYRYS